MNGQQESIYITNLHSEKGPIYFLMKNVYLLVLTKMFIKKIMNLLKKTSSKIEQNPEK